MTSDIAEPMRTLPSLLRNESAATTAMIGLATACAGSLRWLGEPVMALTVALAVMLAVLVCRHSRYGFAALPPLLLSTSFPPAFNDPGTLIFIGIAALWAAAELIRVEWRALPRYPRWLIWLGLGTILLLGINFAAAMHHGISLGAWLRGLFPFLLFALALPLLLHRPDTRVWVWMALSVGVACAVLSAEIVTLYWVNRLWEDIPVSNALVQHFFHSAQGQHAAALNGPYPLPTINLRITLALPEAAGIYAPLGAVGWFLAAHYLPSRYRWFAIAAAALCVCAVLATITRSMAACVALSGLLTLAIYEWKSRERFLRSIRIGIAIVLVSAPFLLGTGAVHDMLTRNQQLIEYMSLHGEGSAMLQQDVGYRLQEYRQAWQAFSDAPFTGQGFGHAITLVLPSYALGKEISITATYTHNWFFYWLMVAGIQGLLLYAFISFSPLARMRAARGTNEFPLGLVLAGGTLLIVTYGLFFAVYRTLPNVLCLTMLLAWTLNGWNSTRNFSDT